MNVPNLGQLSCCVWFVINVCYSQVLVEASREESLFERQSGTILILERSEIEQFKDFSLDQLLSRYSSLYLSKQGPQSSLFLRGSNSSHIAVYLNGIKLNDPSNPSRSFDFSKIALSSIERIEISQGPQSVLFGGDAIGGVISITTRTSADNNSWKLSYGRYKSLETSLAVAEEFKKLTSVTNIDYLKKEGHSLATQSQTGSPTPDGRERVNLSQSFSFQQAKFYLGYSRDKFDIDRSTNDGLTDDANDFTKDEQIQGTLNIAGNFSQNFQFDYSLGSHLQTRKTYQIPDDIHSQDQLDIYRSSTIDLKLNHLFQLRNWSTRFGADSYYEQAKSPGKNHALTQAIFVQQRYDQPDYFFSLGARYEDHEYFHQVFNQSLAIGFYPSQNSILKYHYGTGFKAPTLFQLFDPNYGNNELTPEKSIHHELSYYYSRFLQLSVFETRYKNLIGYDELFVSINEGASRIRGAELQATAYLAQRHQLHFDFTFLQAIQLDTKEELLRRPQQKWGSKWQAEWSERWHSFVQLQWISSRKEFSGDRLGAFSQVDTLVKYQYSQNSTLSFKFENLLKANNQTAAGFNTGGRLWTLGYETNF